MYIPWLVWAWSWHGKAVDVRDIALTTRIVTLVERTIKNTLGYMYSSYVITDENLTLSFLSHFRGSQD